jgi:hypothetical protein
MTVALRIVHWRIKMQMNLKAVSIVVRSRHELRGSSSNNAADHVERQFILI